MAGHGGWVVMGQSMSDRHGCYRVLYVGEELTEALRAEEEFAKEHAVHMTCKCIVREDGLVTIYSYRGPLYSDREDRGPEFGAYIGGGPLSHREFLAKVVDNAALAGLLAPAFFAADACE